MMQDGMYWLRLVAYDKSEEGVAVVRQGLVNGGGPGYVWQGRLISEDGTVRGNLVVRKWNPQTPPDLGMFKTANLGIDGRHDASARSFELEGHAHGHHVVHLHISGHWLGELTDGGL
ncbi:MAG: GrlR family regulatory protein [Desulfomicrobium apsheronum]|nr:GrlR family regulatory protein [Desulfomicrobium apsheronum]